MLLAFLFFVKFKLRLSELGETIHFNSHETVARVVGSSVLDRMMQ